MLKFTQFHKENYIKYQEMYIDLSLPQLVEPFIILDLLPSFFQLLQDDCQTVYESSSILLLYNLLIYLHVV